MPPTLRQESDAKLYKVGEEFRRQLPGFFFFQVFFPRGWVCVSKNECRPEKSENFPCKAAQESMSHIAQKGMKPLDILHGNDAAAARAR